MRIVKIVGGLGNQMFHYAFFLSLKSSKKGDQIKVDTSNYNKYSLHNGLEIENIFNISLSEHIATRQEISSLRDSYPLYKLRRFAQIFLKLDVVRKSHIIDRNYTKYEAKTLDLGNVYLDGYWQSERYFNNIRELILNSYMWSNLSQQNLEISNKMQTENSVAVHIRRFDNPKNIYQLIYKAKALIATRTPSEEYYLNSIDYFKTNIENPKFYIFTDDLKWVHSNLNSISKDSKIIDWNRGVESHWDMFLMTQCKHNIISMSSFSWWGAWLNNYKQKIVIAPKKWVTRFIKDVDLIPEKWIRL
jgi:hypothetical protein